MKVMSGIGKLCLIFAFVSLTYAIQSNNLNFAVDTKTSTEIKFSWINYRITGRSGLITEFRIECSRKNKSEIVQNRNRIDSSSKSYTIKGLESYKQYTCELKIYGRNFSKVGASLNTRTLPGDICSQPLGLENGALPDDQIELPSNDNDKKIFRLNSIGNAFSVSTKDVILSFDFKRLIKVTGFAIKSFKNVNFKFYFEYQTFENKNFRTIKERDGPNILKTFKYPQGSIYTSRYQINDNPITARYLRLINNNTEYKTYSLKVEFYGCSEVCSNLLKHENLTLENKSVVSSISNPELYSNEEVCLNKNDGLHYSFRNTVKLSGISILNTIRMGSQKINLTILCTINRRNFTAVDQSRLFGGAVDAGDVLTSWLVTEEYCKHIQVILVSPLNICLQIQLLGCQSGCVDKLGIEKNETGIKYTASSYWGGGSFTFNSPYKGRLNVPHGGWSSRPEDINGKRFWQACLTNITLISGVFVQGRGSYAGYIQKFLVLYSYKEVNKNSTVGLHEYTSNGSLVIFNGSTNRYETNFLKLPTPIFARCLRLYGNCTRRNGCGARFEFVGCKNAPLPSPMISWYPEGKILACKISNAQPEVLDMFVFKQQITSNSNYNVHKSEYDYVKHGYKKVNVTILANLSSLIPTYRNCFDNKTRKTFYCSTEYSCRANFDGKKAISQSETQVLSVDFIEIPATPTNPTVQEFRSTSVKIAFTLNANQKIFPIISYFVRITNSNQSEFKAFKNDGSGSIILEMLTPFTDYTVYIKSANKYYNSTEEKVSFQTDCRPKSQTTQTFINLNKTKICKTTESSNCSSVSVVAKNLTVATANKSIKIQQDVRIITDTINNIVKNINTSDVNQTRQVVDDILTTYNNILDVDPNIIGKSQTLSSSSTDLLLTLDDIANKLSSIINQDKNFSSLQIAKKNIAFDIRSTLRKNITVVGSGGPLLESTDLQLQIAENNGTILVNKGFIASIEIPSTSFPNDNAIIHVTLFNKPSFFIPREKLKSIAGEDMSTSQFIETGVISFSFGTNVTIENLTIPIIIRLKRRSSSDGRNVCVFWDFNLPSGISGVQGDWSTRGCKYAGSDTQTGFSICECNHLTNFALLLDVSQTGNNPFELQMVTWIGFAISIFGLLMTIISSLIFKKLLRKLPQKILVSLCISLLALLIVFLAGAEETSSRLGCQIVAGLLHYLILTTFCWMFIEAISLYRSFITVFKSGSQTKFFWKACVFAWGVPAIIVAISAGIDHEHYGNDRICTVLGNAFYFAVLLPVILIIVVNIIVLVAVMDVLVRLSSKRAKRLRKNNNPFSAVRIAFACNALLGATWIFALLAVKDATTTFQWLFCICNSLQGFFIFIFYTVRNKDVRNEWRRLLGLPGKDGASSIGKFHLKLPATSKKGRYSVSISNSEKTKSTAYSFSSSIPS